MLTLCTDYAKLTMQNQIVHNVCYAGVAQR